MYTVSAKCKDGTVIQVPLREEEENGRLRLFPDRADYKNMEYIDFAPRFFVAAEGDDGYFVIPQGKNDEDCMLAYFHGHAEGVTYEGGEPVLPLFGVRHPSGSFAAFVTGMRHSFHMVAGVLGGVYYLYPRFVIGGEEPYEIPEVTYVRLPYEEADYSAMAREYRRFLIETGVCKPIAERENETLRYAKKSIYVRIRQAWKPVPSPVEHQTPENEPPMHVACTFERVGQLMDAFHERGIEKAEFCLVGWNYRGHDGRWPQAFPVEPELGGEVALRALIEKANTLGYQITCHSNSTAAYEIASGFTEDWLCLDKEGRPKHSPYLWGGGREYDLCPKVSLDFAQKTLPEIAELGFHGLHYVDVISCLPIKTCQNPLHPVNPIQAQRYNEAIGELSRQLFGGFSSEGARSHLARVMDFSLYVSYNPFKDPTALPPIADERVPLWQLVFHGIILSNPYTDTVNAPVKGRENVLKLFERGGRPSLYYYSKFVTDKEGSSLNNWMGNTDFIMDTEEDLALSADRAAALYREYESMADLQDKFMDKHEKIAEGVYRVTYSDGSTVEVNYNSGEVQVKRA